MIVDIDELEAGLPYIETRKERIFPKSKIEGGELIIFESPLFINRKNGIMDSLDGGIHPLLEDYAFLYRGVWEWRDNTTVVFKRKRGDKLLQGVRHSRNFSTCWYTTGEGQGEIIAEDERHVNCPCCLKYMRIEEGGYYLIISSMDRPMDILDVKSPDTLNVLKRLGFLPTRREKIIRVEKYRRVDSYPFSVLKHKKDEDHNPVFEEKRERSQDSVRRMMDYRYREFYQDEESA